MPKILKADREILEALENELGFVHDSKKADKMTKGVQAAPYTDGKRDYSYVHGRLHLSDDSIAEDLDNLGIKYQEYIHKDNKLVLKED